jgi:hypothetical protein
MEENWKTKGPVNVVKKEGKIKHVIKLVVKVQQDAQVQELQ